MKMDRWVHGAIPSIAVHLSIGSVYAWSVFANPVMEALDITYTQAQLAFSIAIFFLGTSAAFLGDFVSKYGPRVSAKISAICFAIGLIGAGFAVQAGSLPLLYLFYGVIGGIGLGTGYITPVKCLVSWFADHKGLATGLAVMGFGFASTIAAPIIQNLIEIVGLKYTFIILGIVYGIIIMTSSFLIKMPPENHLKPVGNDGKPLVSLRRQYTANEAMKTWHFYVMWLMLFVNITVGIALLAVASPMLQENVGLSVGAAAGIVGVMSIFNGGGRFFWATISDYIGRPKVYTGFFIMQIIAFLLLANTTNALLFQVLLFLIMTCYGGGFSCIPAYLSDVFGDKDLSAIHGRILTAWAIAGLVGPTLTSKLYEITGGYSTVLYVFVAFLVVAFFASARLMAYLSTHGTNLSAGKEKK